MLLFAALCALALAIAGATAYVIFWPLALVTLRDRHPAIHASMGSGAFLSPRTMRWLLSGEYRGTRDAAFTGLATPAMLSLATILLGLAIAGVLWLWSVAAP